MTDIKKTFDINQLQVSQNQYPSTSDKHGYHGFDIGNSYSESLNPNNIYEHQQNSTKENHLNMVSNIEDFELQDEKNEPYIKLRIKH